MVLLDEPFVSRDEPSVLLNEPLVLRDEPSVLSDHPSFPNFAAAIYVVGYGCNQGEIPDSGVRQRNHTSMGTFAALRGSQ